MPFEHHAGPPCPKCGHETHLAATVQKLGNEQGMQFFECNWVDCNHLFSTPVTARPAALRNKYALPRDVLL
jgi:hypothetical protein